MPSAFCLIQAKQRHTAHIPTVEVQITYPFHPRSGAAIQVAGSKRHAGVVHFVVRQLDNRLTLLPAWMTEPAAATCEVRSAPRLPLDKLFDLRALFDAALAPVPQNYELSGKLGDFPV
jgi:hypothetical protein